MTRRSLVRATSLAAATAFAADRELSVAFITEPGGTHLELMVSGIAKCPGIGVVSIADESSKSFERVRALVEPAGHQFRTFTSIPEMLKSAKPDLTVVTVEARNNPRLALLALRAGSHVMCEKPPCLRLAEFQSLATAARSANRQLMLAMATRSNPSIAKARTLIQRGWLGKPCGVAMNWVGDQTRLTTEAWRRMWVSHKSRAGGGKLAFHGIHYLDVIQYLTDDRIVSVSGLCRNVGGQPLDVEDAAVLALRFRGGATGTLNTGYYLDKGNANVIELWADKGWIRFDPFVPLQWYSTHPQAPKGEQAEEYESTNGDYDRMMAQAVRGVSGGAPFMTTEESLHLMKVIFAGYKASDTGEAQRVDS